MNAVQFPHGARIDELVRLLDESPSDTTLQVELDQLRVERRAAMDRWLEEQAVEVGELVERQIELESPPKSVRMQYRATCALYKEICALVKRNRELKRELRRML